MGLSIRSYVRAKTGEISRIPHARFERLWNGDDREAWPEYASDHVYLAIAYVETEDGEPVRLAQVDYLRLKLDAQGRLGAEVRQRMLRLSAESMDLSFLSSRTQPASLIAASHRFARRQRQHEFSWKPTMEQEKSIVRSALRPRRR